MFAKGRGWAAHRHHPAPDEVPLPRPTSMPANFALGRTLGFGRLLPVKEPVTDDSNDEGAVRAGGAGGGDGSEECVDAAGVLVGEPRERTHFRLEDFRVVRVLGTGSFGVVHLVHQTRDLEESQYFAMKVMYKAEIVQLRQVEHVHAERSLLFSLDRTANPFVVRLYQTFQDRTRLYMLMEFVQGGELFHHLRACHHFGRAAAMFYAAEVLVALDGLHRQGIAYRDLKPENILLNESGHVRLTDFGFAKRVASRTWTLCGTPEYLAPEVITASGHGRGADWWSFGVLLFEMLTGRPPFHGTTPYDTYEKIVEGRFAFPREPALDAESRDLITRLLQRDVTKRLGCFRNGARDIMAHPFFAPIADWHAVARERLAPPFVPPVCGAGDASNFDDYDCDGSSFCYGDSNDESAGADDDGSLPDSRNNSNHNTSTTTTTTTVDESEQPQSQQQPQPQKPKWGCFRGF